MNFCTYFDKNYLSRGLALYESLLKNHKGNFNLYIIAFDQFTFNFFKKKKLKFITCIYYEDFEDKDLKKVKNSRRIIEYLWTCTPSIILFVLKKYKLNSCTYLDADIYFFSNPKIIYVNQLNYSVLITNHNYYSAYDQTHSSGKYCVQYLTFKNNKFGLEVLKWWRKKCIQWCYNRVENNKFGDQKYLDCWPEKFREVKVSKHLGAGLAPWNVKRFKITSKKKIIISENYKNYDLIFYHFHDLKILFNGKLALLSSYDLSKVVKAKIYIPYIKAIISIEKKYNLKFNIKNSEVNLNIFSKLIYYIKLIFKLIIYFKNVKRI